RGVQMSPHINSLIFPRDMMTTFNGVPYINPKANFDLVYTKGIQSPLGEGGRILKQRNKVFVPTVQDHLASDPRYEQHIRSLERKGFEFGYLPWPLAVDAIPGQREYDVAPSDHLDRAAAFIRGKDSKDYLLLDENYAQSRTPRVGSYSHVIENACYKLDVTPVVVERAADSIPYALNLEQFTDGTVLMTGGDPALQEVVGQLVGDDKVATTEVPIVYYPVIRKGGIRCMTLTTSDKIIQK
ncbi:MAG TPA: hypothetical protein VG935_00005, partial [Patescibacteria group bacterium]|nr:hypothetical protein [Patescibacteria group bacterium]